MKMEVLESRLEGYELEIQFLEMDIKTTTEDLNYNKKMLSECESIKDMEYYMEKMQTNINRLKELNLKKSIIENFIKTLNKIK